MWLKLTLKYKKTLGLTFYFALFIWKNEKFIVVLMRK